MSEPVTHSWSGSVLEITLNRPDRLNSFNDEMHVALAECMDMARDDGRCRAVLLTGAGRGFCAGQDLSARDPAATPLTAQTTGLGSDRIRRISGL